MIFPTVHLNGTSKEALVEGYLNAHRAVHAAMDALLAAYPNGRDYYPQGLGALPTAEREHDMRLLALKLVADDLMALAEKVQDGE